MRILSKYIIPLFLALVFGVGSISNTQAGGDPRFRVMHASPDTPNVDIYLDGQKIISNLGYKGLSGYLAVTPGMHRIKVTQAGLDFPSIIEVDLSFGDGQDYTLVAMGQPENLEIRQFKDDNSPPEGPDKAKIRFAHTSTDLGAVNICSTGQKNCFVTNLTFTNVTGYVSFDNGTYSLDIRRERTGEVIKTFQDLIFRSEEVYTVFVVGLVDGARPLELVVSTDARWEPSQPPVTGGGYPTSVVAEAEWPKTMYKSDSEPVIVSLLQVTGGYTPVIEVEGNLKVNATIVPVGTPGPIGHAYGDNYQGFAIAKLSGINFDKESEGLERQSLEQPSITWRWTIKPKDVGDQTLNVNIIAKWEPTRDDVGEEKVHQLWSKSLEILVTEPFIVRGQLNFVTAASSIIGLMLTSPWLYQNIRKSIRRRQKEKDSGFETAKNYRKTLNTLYRNLARLEERAAKYGLDVPIKIENEIDLTKEKIEEIQERLKDLEEKARSDEKTN